jgi:hypothetical protein
VAAMPAWLGVLLRQRPAKTKQEMPGDTPIDAGARNSTLVRMAGAMRRAGFTPEAVRLALRAHNRERCSPPLESEEVDAIAENAARWAVGPSWIRDPAAFVSDPRLDLRARMVLFVLASHAGPSGRTWPGYRRIESVGGVSRRHIRRCLDQLEAAGRIETLQRARHGNRYRVLDYHPPPTTGSSGNPGDTNEEVQAA